MRDKFYEVLETLAWRFHRWAWHKRWGHAAELRRIANRPWGMK
jgi:hypothetical protein